MSIEDGCLHIKAEKESTGEDTNENFTRCEFSYNYFQRSIQLPDNVKDEDIKASYSDGILSFKLTKKENSSKLPAKRIKLVRNAFLGMPP